MSGRVDEQAKLSAAPIACLSDNYAYILATSEGAVVVDPSEVAPIVAALEAHDLPLRAILCTHHHLDHVGGVMGLKALFPTVEVIAHAHDRARIEGVTRTVEDRAHFAIAELTIDVIYVPGHTLGAVTYVVTDAAKAGEPAWAFTGDTLFLAGCGRFFEGTPAQMHTSLCERLAALPDETRIACGHEYTESNLRFAAHVEPENQAVATRLAEVRALRASGTPTVPGTLRQERATNPFMRVDVAAVRRHVGAVADDDGVEVMHRLREEKNAFR